MDAARYQRLKQLYADAQACTESDRASFLERACGDDLALRHELIRLLMRDDVPTGDLAPRFSALDAPPQIVGPYRLGRELGSGGMGSVYRATDERDGRTIAIKFLHAHLHLSKGTIERFLREGELGRDVGHENVVRTLEAGEAGGRPYLAMEYVEGKSLRELLNDLGTVPERLVREIGLQAARGLAAIHDKGIVHRDLKPENILLTDDERVRIMDLGIAKAQEASLALTREGHFLGSIPYAAPEQCELGDVGPAADLYSLGVVLHELATGDNPFRKASPAASQRAQLDLLPPAPPHISPFLASVIGSLLEKDPAERVGGAALLAGILHEGEDSAWWSEREKAATRVPVSREIALIGREAERERLGEPGRAVWLSGEAGIGKSRLVDELLGRFSGHVLYGSFPPEGRLSGFRDAVVGLLGRANLEEKLAPFVPEPLVAPFASLLRQEAAEESLPAIEAAFRALLEGLAAEKPVLWVVDDLHHAPEEARRVAAALARAARGRRALVVLTSRDAIPAEFPAEALPLSRLDEADVRRMAAAVLRDDVEAARIAGWLSRKSDGVPFFALALLRALEEQGFVTRNERGEGSVVRDPEEFAAPSELRELVAVRLRGLDGAEREIADLASVLGYEFEAELVAEVLQRPLVRVLQELAEIERGHGLVRAAGRAYRFDHHQVQEVLYGALPERLREEYHALLAKAIERRLPGEPEGSDRYLVTRHHLRGSRPEKGLAHLDGAIEYLSQRHRSHEIARLSALALARPGLVVGPARFDLLKRRFDAVNLIGDRAAEKAALRELIGAAEGPAARTKAYLCVAGFYGSRGRLLPATRAYDRALAEEANDPALRVAVLTGRAGVFWRRGRNEEAIGDLEEAIRLAREAGDDDSEARALVNLGILEKDIGQLRKSDERMVAALAIAKRTGNRRVEAYASGNLGLAAWHDGRLEEARTHMRHCLDLSVELGDRRIEITSIGNLGMVDFDAGDIDAAEDAFRRQEELARALDDHINLLHALKDRGWMRYCRGDHAAAIEKLDEAHALAKRAGVVRTVAHAQLRRSWIEMAEGRMEEAEKRAREAQALFRDEAQDPENVAFAGLTIGDLAYARGDEEEAERRWRESEKLSAEIGVTVTRIRALARLASIGKEDRKNAADLYAAHEPRLSWWESADIRDHLPPS